MIMVDIAKKSACSIDVLEKLDEAAEKKTLDSAFLLQLLAEQCERKVCLEIQRQELQDDTQAGIKERISTCKSEVDAVTIQFNSLKSKINKFLKEKLPSKVENAEVYENINRISHLEKASAYLVVCDYIKTTSEQMEANLETGLESEAIDLLDKLQALSKTHFDTTDCTNLKAYYTSTMLHWEEQLKRKLTKDFEELLIAFGWPLTIKTSIPTLENHEKFHRTIRNLIRLSITRSPSTDNTSIASKSALVIDFKGCVIPVQIMVAPLRKRFGFHFYSPKATGDTSRPEWYFTQVRAWLRDLVPFIRTHLEPLSITEVHVSCVVDFVRSMSEMVVLKADSQLKSSVDDVIFSRILEESIAYENNIVDFLGNDVENKDVYIPPIVSTLFSQPAIFQKWLSIERMACYEKLDEMFRSPSAWNRSIIPGPADIVDLFIAVGRFVINRFAHLQQPGQKIQFLQLLMDLIDNFRIRCLQIWQTTPSTSADLPFAYLIEYTIADTIGYVQYSMETWEELPFFTSLSLYLENIRSVQAQADKIGLIQDDRNRERNGTDEISAAIGQPHQGLFYDEYVLYDCLGEEILKKWSRNVLEELCLEVRKGYSIIKWHSYQGQKSPVSDEIMTIIPMLQSVKATVYGQMDNALAEKWWKRVLFLFDEMIMEEVVQKHQFSSDAIAQISKDFDAIFTMLLGSSIDTSIFFRNMGCTIKVWNLTVGAAMLLYETLSDTSNSFDTQTTALAELELSLCASDIIRLLKTRTDVSNR